MTRETLQLANILQASIDGANMKIECIKDLRLEITHRSFNGYTHSPNELVFIKEDVDRLCDNAIAKVKADVLKQQQQFEAL